MTVSFDTLEYAETLERGGFDKTLAENHARALANVTNKLIEYRADSSKSTAEINNYILFEILDYANQLINANEKPSVALAQSKILAKHLIAYLI